MPTFVLVDTTGAAHTLDAASGVQVAAPGIPRPGGLGMPMFQYPQDKLPYAPGVRLRRMTTPGRDIDLPILAMAATPAALEDLMDAVRGWVLPGTEYQPEPSTVVLRITRDDGDVREIEAVYAGGLEGGQDVSGPGYVSTVLSLRAPDPYWQDAADAVLTFDSGSGLHTWFPFFPFDVTASQVFSERTVANTGQVEAWPVWRINGPGRWPTLRNVTTGAYLTLQVTLGQGDYVTIDTRPTRKTVMGSTGVNLFPLLTITSELWPLVVGNNTVRVELENSDVTSSVLLNYRRRWAGVWR